MNNFKRPKLHIPKTKLEWISDSLGYVALAVMVGLIVFNWSKMPDQIPAHFGISGEVDRWGSKMELFILPGIAIFLQIVMTVVEKFPETHNYPARFNESNAKKFYTNSRQTVNYMKNIINVLFAYAVYITISIALGTEATLGWPFFGLLALLLIVMVWKMIGIYKIK